MRKSVLLLTCFFSTIVFSQEKTQVNNHNWNFLIEPYLMFPSMKGTTGIGILPDVKVDASSKDIFNNLKMGAMLAAEASNENWAISTDFIYMNLSQDVKTNPVITGGTLNAKQFAWELAVFKKFTPWLEFGLGTLLNSIKAGVDIDIVNNNFRNTTNLNKESNNVWLDPMFLARIKNKEGNHFLYQLRGEIGIANNLAWQVQAYAGYRFTKTFQLTAGYRWIGLDYSHGENQNHFLYDMNTFGPVVRLGINF